MQKGHFPVFILLLQCQNYWKNIILRWTGRLYRCPQPCSHACLQPKVSSMMRRKAAGLLQRCLHAFGPTSSCVHESGWAVSHTMWCVVALNEFWPQYKSSHGIAAVFDRERSAAARGRGEELGGDVRKQRLNVLYFLFIVDGFNWEIWCLIERLHQRLQRQAQAHAWVDGNNSSPTRK